MSKKELRKLNKNNTNSKDTFTMNNMQKQNIKKLEDAGMDVKDHNGFETNSVILCINGLIVDAPYSLITEITKMMDNERNNNYSNSLKLHIFF